MTVKYGEILRLASKGFSRRNIALSVPCSRNTVAKVLERAEELRLSWPLPEGMDEQELNKHLFGQDEKAPQDTLRANADRCVGMAANMIGVKKCVIIVNMGLANIVMYNPVIIRKDSPYETEEGCLSLDGVRKCTRYRNIEVGFLDSSWKKQRLKLSGWPAQICQHEIDHLSGIII
ncbi:MAG: peptide deformylase [Anaerolineaceae bacterium]|nr:peptide deformylase [Anaerolineaceae bacterium]